MQNTIADFLRSINRPTAPAFHFLNFGILASLGNNEAVAQVQLGEADLLKAAGSKAFLLWQSVYIVKQVIYIHKHKHKHTDGQIDDPVTDPIE